VLSPAHDPRRALKERVTQNALVGLGYPVPRVLAASADRGPLGAGFLLMERAAGRPLLEARPWGVSAALADMHLRLHALDAETLLRALDEEGRAAGGGVGRCAVTLESHLGALARRVEGGPWPGLAAGMRWLLARRPLDRDPVICHGDFHPQNLLVADGRVSAVLDWPNVLVADAECDVAATLVILRLTPIELFPVPAALRPLLGGLRSIMTGRYLARYRRARPLDAARLAYYEAAGCMRGLVRTTEARLASSDNALDVSSFGERLAARFARVTGVAVSLPPPPR
jgi:aminoglycoside phosphotransferase (APT) family kinase protein